jgi:hypothetical protein
MKKFVFAAALLLGLPAAIMAQRQGPTIALLDSSINTAEFFDRRYGAAGPCSVGTFLGEDEYRRYVLGWKYVLDGNRFLQYFPDSANPAPVDMDGNGDALSAFDYQIIRDVEITDGSLDSFAILILSNTASLSDDQERAIQRWVLKGGKLIATYGSGYKGIVEDQRLDDQLKYQSGGTFGIHQLWHDPATKAFGTESLEVNPGIDVQVTK